MSRGRRFQRESVMAYRWVVLVFGILAYATSIFARQNYAGVQKFIAQDLHLDKGALGLMGSVFFYAYALFQLPCGIASEKFGGRWIAGLGVLLTAGAMAGFATGETEGQLLVWRVLAGIAGAAAYVSMSGSLAHWFSPSERGFSQAALGGVGGALGESSAFLLLPVISIYFASGWRQGTNVVAAAIALLGILCLVFLRPAPSERRAAGTASFDWKVLADPRLWCYTLLFSAFIVAIRIMQPWIAVYAADVYIVERRLSMSDATLQGGVLAMIAYSMLGRGIGNPLGGKLSDILVRRGISRETLAILWLTLAVVLFQILSAGLTATWSLGVTAFLLGVSVNLFTLITAAASEAYGPQKTASIVSFMVMVSQLAGATALALSGYAGMSLGAGSGNALVEYRGIWLSAMVGVLLFAVPGAAMYLALTKGWIGERRELLSGATKAET